MRVMKLGMVPLLAPFVATSMLRHLILSYLICTSPSIDFITVHAYISRPCGVQKRLHAMDGSSQCMASRKAKRFARSHRYASHYTGSTVKYLRLSSDPNNSDYTPSRRDMIYSALKFPVFTVATYAYGRVLYNAISSPSIASLFNDGSPIYPAQHEQRVSKMIQIAFDAASANAAKTFRVLEVGIGTEARLMRRGLYNDAIKQLSDKKRIQQLEFTGLDVHAPTKASVVESINDSIQQLKDNVNNMDISFSVVQSSITEPLLQYTDGYFDSIVFCLTLCSVHDPESALRTMKRLLRPNGGTIAYVEHVAVNDDDSDHQLLSFEQQLFDPVQQILADHCHLHRATESTMDIVLADNNNKNAIKYDTLYRERFYIDQMWPVSCQACGVIQSSA